MLPHLWRMPQWLACAATSSWRRSRSCGKSGSARPSSRLCKNRSGVRLVRLGPPARLRLAVSLAVIVVGPGRGVVCDRRRHLVRVTVFQPFRMATVARGIALVFVAGGSSVYGNRRMAGPDASHPARRVGHRRLADGRRDLGRAGCLGGRGRAIRLTTHPLGLGVPRCRRLFGMLGLGLNFLGTTTPSMVTFRFSRRSARVLAGRTFAR